VALDVDDPGSVQRGVAEVHGQAGRIDVLINNAGFGGGGPIEDVPVDWVQTLFETNYFGWCASPRPSCRACASAAAGRS
jgi:NAD(P)-dependent dehydrogenase (short-subunit alcohol dehydrogenase family)